jgi:hypothetical protein
MKLRSGTIFADRETFNLAVIRSAPTARELAWPLLETL